jgi:LCCL domain
MQLRRTSSSMSSRWSLVGVSRIVPSAAALFTMAAVAAAIALAQDSPAGPAGGRQAPLSGPRPSTEAKPAGPTAAPSKAADKKAPAATAKKDKLSRPVGPPTLEVRLADGGSLHLALLDERAEFITPYGRLSVPMADVQRIEFATRISPDVTEQVEKAIHNLSADEFDVREKASADLLALKERAYAALLKAAEHSDPEVARRAEELLEKLRDSVSEERLAQRENDVVYTRDSKFTGKLVGESLKVLTAPFGEQRLKFADVLSLGQQAAESDSTASRGAIADPGTLQSYQAMIGRTLTFRVTGSPAGSIWGTDMYTLDTQLATAAVHAGVVKAGETGLVRIQILGPQAAFVGSARHGVTSSDYAGYPGAYRILTPRRGGR